MEKPFGVIVQYGGQTPLKLALDLEANGVPIIGTSPDMIDAAEDRERFQQSAERPRPAPAAEPHRAHRGRSLAPGAGNRLSAGGAAVLCAGRAGDGNRPRAARPRALHARSGEGVARFAGAAGPLPERCDRSRRRCLSRWHAHLHRRHHGTHRTGRRAFGRLGLLAAAVFAVAGDHRRIEAPDRG